MTRRHVINGETATPGADSRTRIHLAKLVRLIGSASWKQSSISQINGRVVEGLRNDDRDHIEKYLDWLYANISNSIQAIRRLATYIIALMTVFEIIISSGATATVTIFSFTLPKHSIVFQLLPAVVAYLDVQMTYESIELNRSQAAFNSAFGLWSSHSKRNGLYEYIWPPSSLHWSPFFTEMRASRTSGDRIKNRTIAPFSTLFNLALIAFEIQAYYILFVPHIDKILVLWIGSACFTLYCTAAEMILIANETGLIEMAHRLRAVAQEMRHSQSAP
jgi:hypothetical protein